MASVAVALKNAEASRPETVVKKAPTLVPGAGGVGVNVTR
jgi:hypothetical protein